MTETNGTEVQMMMDVTICKDGMTATDRRGTEYKIESIMLGVGKMRKAVKWSKNTLSPGSPCRAEILKNGKLNING